MQIDAGRFGFAVAKVNVSKWGILVKVVSPVSRPDVHLHGAGPARDGGVVLGRPAERVRRASREIGMRICS